MRTLLLASVLLVTGSQAFADPSATPDVQKMAGDDCARARKAGKTCVLDMGAQDVAGDSPTADRVDLSLIRFRGTASSLIRIRRDFIPEILRTAEDVN